MREGLSPKALAQSIGVSESSLKRWSDEGLLNAARTAGGHRRIALPEAVRFIRAVGATVIRPDLLGLAEVAQTPAPEDRERAHAMVREALESGDGARTRALLQSLYLGGWSAAEIFDGPVRVALASLGELWQHAEWGIVVEHRATNVAIQAINQLRGIMPSAPEHAPVALGCSCENDPYVVPTLMASCVLGEAGFRDVNLGNHTPMRVLIAAARQYTPALVWISASVSGEFERRRHELTAAAKELAEIGARLVVGGRGFASSEARALPGVSVAGTMQELDEVGRAVLKDARAAANGAEPRPAPLQEAHGAGGSAGGLTGGSPQAHGSGNGHGHGRVRRVRAIKRKRDQESA